jgi:hypothetical protein
MNRRPNHRSLALTGAALLLAGLTPAHAIDAIELQVRELTVAGIPVSAADVRLDLPNDQQARVTLRARQLTLPDPAGKLTDFALVCDRLVISEPRFGCAAGRLTTRGGPTGSIDMQVSAEMRSDTGVTTFSGKGLEVAGTTAAFDGHMDARGWQVKASTASAKVSALRKFAAPWFQLSADITGDGDAVLEGTFGDTGAGLDADVTAKLKAVDLTNEASTIVADKMAASARLRAATRGADTLLDLELQGSAGQVLVNPILLDFGKNPLSLVTRGKLSGKQISLDTLSVSQKDALELTGQGRVDLAPEVPEFSGELTLARVQFPAAFTSDLR